MRLDYGNNGNSYPNPEPSNNFTQMCRKCHVEYETEYSTAYEYEKYCCEECESNDCG